MKKLFTAIAVGLAAFALSACNGTAPPIKVTPAQFFAIACLPVQQALELAPTLTALPASVQAQLPAATSLANTTCAVGATVSVASVQQFVATSIPAANSIAQAVPDNVLSAAQKQKIAGFSLLAELVIDTGAAIAANAQAAAAATPASAPTAASTPLAGAPFQ